MELLIASHSQGKAGELKRMFSDVPVLTLNDFPGIADVVEDRETFLGNSKKKAIQYHEWTDLPVIADDSGLCVDALNGAPGVYTARYASHEGVDGMNNIDLLLDNMRNETNRDAEFVTVLSYFNGPGTFQSFKGTVQGTITRTRMGTNGFAYDVVFQPNGYSRTFAQMTDDEKQAISHRRNAFEKFRRYFDSIRIKI